jgi:hypothetical protein
MTDLERLELICRRIADRERVKCSNGDITDLTHVRVFDELAAELAKQTSALRSDIK